MSRDRTQADVAWLLAPGLERHLQTSVCVGGMHRPLSRSICKSVFPEGGKYNKKGQPLPGAFEMEEAISQGAGILLHCKVLSVKRGGGRERVTARGPRSQGGQAITRTV